MRGFGGALAPLGRVKGRQPIAAGGLITGFSRRDQPGGVPLAAGGYPIPSWFLPLCMAALALGAASRLRLRKGRGGRTSEPCNTKQYSLIWMGR